MRPHGHYRYVKCNLSARVGSKLVERACKIAYDRYKADGFDYCKAKCRRCGLEWKLELPSRQDNHTCSDCYSDSICITSLRLWFDDTPPNQQAHLLF